jgi:radical SAM protein with 4Fe4S-binding SPASM domain
MDIGKIEAPECLLSLYPAQSFRTASNNSNIVLNLESDRIYELNEMAGDVWSRLSGSRNVSRLYRELQEDYDISPATLYRDLVQLLQELASEDLIRFSCNPTEFRSSEFLEGRRIVRETVEQTDPLEARLLQEHSLYKFVPFSAQIELTYRCNEHCVHCYCTPCASKARRELDFDRIVDILRQLRDLGCFKLTLTGGEPFLRRDLLDIIDCAKDLKFAIDLYTNATLISEDIADRLAANYLRSVQVSVYSSNPNQHDAITRHKGSFSKTMTGIRFCVERNIPTVMKCPLLRGAAGDFRNLKMLAKESGADLQFSALIAARNDGSEEPHKYWASEEELAAVFRDSDPENFLGSSRWAARVADFDALQCGAGATMLHLTPFGDVLPCVAIPIVAGNISTSSIQDIWGKAEIFKTLRSMNLRSLTQCSQCSILSYCSRCPGVALREDGNLAGVSKNSCRLATIRKEVVTEKF